MSADERMALRALELVRTIAQDDADAFAILIGATIICAGDSEAPVLWLGTAMASLDAARRRPTAGDVSTTLAEMDTILIQKLNARNTALTTALEHSRRAAKDNLRNLDGALSEIRRLERELDELRCGDLVTFQSGELSPERAEKFRSHLARCKACQHGLQDLTVMDARLSDDSRPKESRRES